MGIFRTQLYVIYKRLKMAQNRTIRDKPNTCYQKESKNAVLILDKNRIQGQKQRTILYGLKIQSNSHKAFSLNATAWSYVTSGRNASRNYEIQDHSGKL